jgi:hypothetical protein
VLAAIGPYTSGGIRIRDAKELRVKESDRIALVAKNLRAMGAEVTEFEDGLDVPGGQKLHGATIDSGGDHRIAMAFSVAALRAEGETLIQGAESAAISFPEFFTLLDSVAERYARPASQKPAEHFCVAEYQAYCAAGGLVDGSGASLAAEIPGMRGAVSTAPDAASFRLMP